MSKKGLPMGISMRHDSHYVEELSKPNKTFGKIISINLIEPNPEQPRIEIGDLEELTLSIKEKGILEPILVKPVAGGNYMIIAGERRWRAANLAGLREVPCIELDLDNQSIAEIALIENLQRKDLTVWEEADGLAALKNKFNYKHEDIAKKISKSRSTVTELLSIAGIPEEIRPRCRALNLNSKASLLEVARQFDEPSMLKFLDNYNGGKLNRVPNGQLKKSPDNTTGANKYQVKINSSTAEDSSLQTDAKGNIFTFVSKNSDFALEIRFHKNETFDKKTVLRALKESFDEIKAQIR